MKGEVIFPIPGFPLFSNVNLSIGMELDKPEKVLQIVAIVQQHVFRKDYTMHLNCIGCF